jgi:hypothetical protein
VNEPLDLPRTEELPPELAAELLPLEPPAPEGPPAPATPASWLRLAYAVEFLVALVAILDVWSEVGGQGHLDLMPWYIKLACVFGLAWCCVRFTAGLVEQSKVWTPRTIAWFAGILLVGIAMGGITYYYHLHEEPADDDDQDTTAASLRIAAPGAAVYDARKGEEHYAPNGHQR